MRIWCCGCNDHIEARLTDGKEMYSHRADLHDLPFWICDTCGNFVGCHHKTKNRTNPLGCIATKEIKDARIHIHALLDPAWRTGGYNRTKLYKLIAKKTGRDSYHTSHIRSIEEARSVYKIIKEILKEGKPC